MRNSTIEIIPLAANCGAKIIGIDLNSASDADLDVVRQTVYAHGVVTLPDQNLTPPARSAWPNGSARRSRIKSPRGWRNFR